MGDAVLSDYNCDNKNGDRIQFAEGESRVVVDTNHEKSYTVTSENAKYLCINVSNGDNDYMPSSFKPSIIGKKYPMYNWLSSFY